MTASECAAVASGDRVAHFAGDFPQPDDRIIASCYINERSPSPDEPWGMWSVLDGALIVGSVCLKHPPDDEGAVEVGYGIAPSHRGRGLATAAVSAIIPIAYAAGARAVTADTEPDNTASIAVLERVGFTRHSVADDGRLWWRISPSA